MKVRNTPITMEIKGLVFRLRLIQGALFHHNMRIVGDFTLGKDLLKTVKSRSKGV